MVQKSAATEAQRRNGTNLADFERHNGTSLRCRHRARAAKTTTRAAAPNRAPHVGTNGVRSEGGAAEWRPLCRSSGIAFSQSMMSKIESFRATLAALHAALPLARQFPLREPSEGPRCRRPAPPEAMQGAWERREPSMKALFAHRRQAPRAAQIYIAATARALANQPHEQLRRTERYMWVLVAWPGVAVRPNASDNAEPSGASHCDPPKRTKKKPKAAAPVHVHPSTAPRQCTFRAPLRCTLFGMVLRRATAQRTPRSNCTSWSPSYSERRAER